MTAKEIVTLTPSRLEKLAAYFEMCAKESMDYTDHDTALALRELQRRRASSETTSEHRATPWYWIQQYAVVSPEMSVGEAVRCAFAAAIGDWKHWGSYVDPALEWHDKGCIKRYGGVSDNASPCACELRAQSTTPAALQAVTFIACEGSNALMRINEAGERPRDVVAMPYTTFQIGAADTRTEPQVFDHAGRCPVCGLYAGRHTHVSETDG